MTGCPVRHDFDPFDVDYLDDPYAKFERLREESPIFYSPEMKMWVLTRHADIEAVFKDPQRFSPSVVFEPIVPLEEESKRMLATEHRAMPVLADSEPPLHTRMRKHLMSVLSARRMKVLEPTVRERAAAMIHALPDGEPVDLVAALTFPLPARTIFDLEGFPDEDVEQLKAWSNDRVQVVFGRLTGKRQREVVKTFVEFSQYCERHVERRLAEPADDLTSDLLEIHRREPEELSSKEVTSILFGLSFAGHETTTNVMGSMLRRIGSRPDVWAQMREDPTMVPKVAEEAIRYDPPVISWRRITKEPVAIDGVEIPAGERILMLLGSANRDQAQFDQADEFRPERKGANRHLGFGKGVHFCQGAPLARMELRIVLEVMTARFESFEVPEQPLEVPVNLAFRGPRKVIATCRVGAPVEPVACLGGRPPAARDVPLDAGPLFDR
jgi:cytochrome P450